jgi:uncharacterized metal-binding protein YceD (DUF177 family)
MKKRCLVDLAALPEEGRAEEGEISGEIFDLPAGDAVSEGPLRYALWIQRFGGELLLTGSLEARFRFECVRTLHPFFQTIRLERAAVSVEIGEEGVVDVTEALREEVLLAFPADPRCEDGDGEEVCRLDSRYLSVDKSAGDGVPTPPRDGRWSVLDRLGPGGETA